MNFSYLFCVGGMLCRYEDCNTLVETLYRDLEVIYNYRQSISNDWYLMGVISSALTAHHEWSEWGPHLCLPCGNPSPLTPLSDISTNHFTHR